MNVDGTLDRNKSRLVAKGVDFVDTFSPVAKMVTVKLMFALAAKKKWFLHQLDISNSFLNGDLSEIIYMDIPPGYAERKGDNLPPNAVLRLKKSIYGLKQASRQWFLKFSGTLQDMRFEKINGDHTLFWSHSDKCFLMVLVYVDDILIANDHEDAISSFIRKLEQCFKLRDLGQSRFFLGIEIARSKDAINISTFWNFLLMLVFLTASLPLYLWIQASN